MQTYTHLGLKFKACASFLKGYIEDYPKFKVSAKRLYGPPVSTRRPTQGELITQCNLVHFPKGQACVRRGFVTCFSHVLWFTSLKKRFLF